ncbi:MAG: hypothetical protein ACUVUU_03825 [bacterium]
MKNKILLWLVFAIFLVFLVQPVFADRGPFGDPPRPWQSGDPDWPALSKNRSSYQAVVRDLGAVRDPRALRSQRSVSLWDQSDSHIGVSIVFGQSGIKISIRR